MSKIVLHRIHYLQNPENCSTARKVICGHFSAGMSATLHHWIYCFIYAYYTNRTMLIDISQWKYLRNVIVKEGVKDYHQFFLPISKCKYTNDDKKIAVTWKNISNIDSTDTHKSPQVIRLPHIGNIFRDMPGAPKTAHYAMPKEILYHVIRYKYEPMAWWFGFFAKYLIRPNHYLQQFIDESRNSLGFKSPIVGLHIRRTDKIIESKFIEMELYMKKIDEYFNKLEKRHITIQRRVFVMTDVPYLLYQLIYKYTKYHFIYPPLHQLSAGTYTTRYSANHLKYFLRDITLLSECDYLVITMSSNVGRLAYELHEVTYSQSKSRHFTSLDIDYNIFGHVPSGGPFIMQAKQDCRNNITDGIDLVKGDYLESCMPIYNSRKLYRGYSNRLKKSGVFPSFCVNYIIDYEKYPDYSRLDTISNKLNPPYINTIEQTCRKSSITDYLL